jgi:methylated-DNA-protein-cysteine methyltransferase related protein
MDVEKRITELSKTTLAIENAVRAIPYGKVSTYGRVALAAGLPGGARQVARVLHTRWQAGKLPWHRVAGQGKNGIAQIKLSGEGFIQQLLFLRQEGIAVNDEGEIDFTMYGFYN